MDYEVQLGFANVHAPEIGEHGVDHVKAAEAFGCLATRVFDPRKIGDAPYRARVQAREHRLPVLVEVITERVTNIAMGLEIDKITEFEESVDLEQDRVLEPQIA